jgi:hypothetical protein
MLILIEKDLYSRFKLLFELNKNINNIELNKNINWNMREQAKNHKVVVFYHNKQIKVLKNDINVCNTIQDVHDILIVRKYLNQDISDLIEVENIDPLLCNGFELIQHNNKKYLKWQNKKLKPGQNSN